MLRSYLKHAALKSLSPSISSRIQYSFCSTNVHIQQRLFCSSDDYDCHDDKPMFIIDPKVLTQKLEKSLKENDPNQAWRALQNLRRSGIELPDRDLVKDSIALLASGDASCLVRAHRLVCYLHEKESFDDYVDGDVLGSLTFVYARAGLFDCSARTFRMLLQRNHYPSVHFWKPLLGLWVQHPHGVAYVIKVFLEICRYCFQHVSNDALQVRPDRDAFSIALRACAVAGESVKAEQILRLMRRFLFFPDNACFCLLMRAYEKSGGLQKIESIVNIMNEEGRYMDSTTVNGMLMSLLNIGELDIAAQTVLCWKRKMISIPNDDDGKVFSWMDGTHGRICDSITGWKGELDSPCTETYVLVAKAFLKKNNVSDAAKFIVSLYGKDKSGYVHCNSTIANLLYLGLRDEVNDMVKEMAALGCPADGLSYSLLVDSYCKLPQPLKAEGLLQHSRHVGHLLDVGSYDSVIDAYSLIQDYVSALRIFQGMKRHGIAPLQPTLTKLLLLFEKNEKPDLMSKLLNSASREPAIMTQVEQWNRTVQALSQQNMMIDAKDTVKRMRRAGLKANAQTYVFLLSGYIDAGTKTNEILLLWAEVKGTLDTKPGSASFLINEELLSGFLTFFLKKDCYRNALEVISVIEKQKVLIEKEKCKKTFSQILKDLRSNKRPMSEKRQKEIDTIKNWVGL